MTEEIYMENDDDAMKNAFMTIRAFCAKHQCSRYTSKYCAWCLDSHEHVDCDWNHQINLSAVNEILKDTDLPQNSGDKPTEEGQTNDLH